MSHEHFTADGSRIILRGICANNKNPTEGEGREAKMYRRYFEHLKFEYDLTYPQGRKEIQK